MTSPQLGLLPACSDDRLAALAAAQLVACGRLELGQRTWAEVRQGVALEPGPQIFDRIEVRRVSGQQSHLDGAIGAVEVLAHDAAAMLGGPVPDNEQLALELCVQCLEKLDDLGAF